jgi:hypothetical protein
MLRNNMIRRVIETKDGTVSSEIYPPELVVAARGLFRADKVYNFQIHASSILGTTAGGAFNTIVNWSPGVTSFSEWSALSALFDEVVLRTARIDVTSALGPASTALTPMICIAPDRTTISGTTPSFVVTQRLAESEMVHPYNLATKESPGRFTKVHHVNRDRPWAVTSAPTGATGVTSGCLGQWNFASLSVGSASFTYLYVALMDVVALRSRA